MKRLETLAAIVILLASTTTARTETTAWDYATDYSSTMNTSGVSAWQAGYLGGMEGHFYLYESYTIPGSESLVRWDYYGDPDTRGCAVKNLSTTSAYENWSMYWEAGQATVMPGVAGFASAVKWTAPTTGQYSIVATWTDQRTDGRSVAIEARFAEDNGATLFSDTLEGFVGRKINNYSDASGTHQSATYSATLNLTAARALDFLVQKTGDGFNTTGLSVTITAVPEPTTITLFVAGVIGLLCYAWRKRR